MCIFLMNVVETPIEKFVFNVGLAACRSGVASILDYQLRNAISYKLEPSSPSGSNSSWVNQGQNSAVSRRPPDSDAGLPPGL